MNRFSLAAATNDLSLEKHVRDVADIVEFRMDQADDPIDQLTSYDGDLPIIATNRGEWFGGHAKDSGRLDRLFTASQFEKVKLVDIELETARGNDWVVNEFYNNDVRTIISFHGFEETPGLQTLKEIFRECAKHGDIAKVATFAEDYSDTINMLNAVNSLTEEGLSVAGISMGTVGTHTRFIAPLYGSKLGYAPLESDPNNYAPGQIPIHKLSKLINTVEETEFYQNEQLKVDPGAPSERSMPVE